MTEYKDGSHQEFIEYLFGSEPKPPHTISLESPPEEPHKNPGLHIFEQLLMIFVDGLKYFYGEEGKVNVNRLSETDVSKIQTYFASFGYLAEVETFATIHEYQFRFPNYFKDQDKITDECVLRDFYYEIYGEMNKVFRITFDHIDSR